MRWPPWGPQAGSGRARSGPPAFRAAPIRRGRLRTSPASRRPSGGGGGRGTPAAVLRRGPSPAASTVADPLEQHRAAGRGGAAPGDPAPSVWPTTWTRPRCCSPRRSPDPGEGAGGGHRGHPQRSGYGSTSPPELGAALAAPGAGGVGLAAGIDGAAHHGALTAGGRTSRRPSSAAGSTWSTRPGHRPLWEEVAAAAGAVCECPLGTEPAPWRFPARNRIIAALAEAVVVVESAAPVGRCTRSRRRSAATGPCWRSRARSRRPPRPAPTAAGRRGRRRPATPTTCSSPSASAAAWAGPPPSRRAARPAARDRASTLAAVAGPGHPATSLAARHPRPQPRRRARSLGADEPSRRSAGRPSTDRLARAARSELRRDAPRTGDRWPGAVVVGPTWDRGLVVEDFCGSLTAAGPPPEAYRSDLEASSAGPSGSASTGRRRAVTAGAGCVATSPTWAPCQAHRRPQGQRGAPLLRLAPPAPVPIATDPAAAR